MLTSKQERMLIKILTLCVCSSFYKLVNISKPLSRRQSQLLPVNISKPLSRRQSQLLPSALVCLYSWVDFTAIWTQIRLQATFFRCFFCRPTLYLLVLSADNFLQTVWTQVRPDKRSGPAKRRAWSGSKLFDTLMVFLK